MNNVSALGALATVVGIVLVLVGLGKTWRRYAGAPLGVRMGLVRPLDEPDDRRNTGPRWEAMGLCLVGLGIVLSAIS